MGRLFSLVLVLAIAGATHAQHRLLLRDEGMSKLSLVDTGTPSAGWQVEVPAGRDLQLVGNGRVMIGTGTGFEEREIATGKKVFETTSWKGTITARRLANRNTVLLGINWQEKEGIVLVELDSQHQLQKTISYPGFTYARLLRETPAGTFLITADKEVIEGNRSGDVIWRATVNGHESPHAWQAIRLANGATAVSTGYPSNMQIFSSDGKLSYVIGGPPEVNPHFFAGFQKLANGNFVVTNWQGHGPSFGAVGIQLLEYTLNGELVWNWKQDPARFSSLQGVIVLDGLDVQRLHVENEDGVLTPRP